MDQPNTLRLDLDYRAPGKIHLNLALRLHTGWPTTALSARLVEGPGGEPVIEPVLGPLYAERVPDYTRVDLRASRTFSLHRGELAVHLAMQNATGRRNVRGYSFHFEVEGEEVVVERGEKAWGRFLPTLGIYWRF